MTSSTTKRTAKISKKTGYPQYDRNSGIFHGETSGSKFMPYTPARKLNGMNIVAIMVNTFITSFIRLLTLDR